jgi:hypothetical protein
MAHPGTRTVSERVTGPRTQRPLPQPRHPIGADGDLD